MSKARLQRETVKHLTYFVVQTFKAVRGAKTGISAEDPREARDEDHALRLVARYRDIHADVVAFRRTGDPKTGDWNDAVIIARHGRLPAEVDSMIDEAEMDPWDIEAGRQVA